MPPMIISSRRGYGTPKLFAAAFVGLLVVAQVLVAEYAQRGFLESHLVTIRAHYAAKAQAMAAESGFWL